MYELRPYQKEAVASIHTYFENHNGNPILALPTGTGKSLIIASFIKEVLQNWPGQRILMLTHVKELIGQNAQKILDMWPEAPMGIYSAGLKKKEPGHSIVLGGIQSVAKLLKKNNLGLGKRDLVIIDECHLISPNQETQYQVTLEILKEANPMLKVIGLTATPYRMKSGSIADGEGIFDSLAFDLCSMDSFNKLLEDGYMAPLIPKRPSLTIDVTSIKLTAGDFNKKDSQDLVDTHKNTIDAVQEIVECGKNRKSWLIFAAGIENAENICQILQSMGVNAETSHSKIGDKENTERIDAFKSGKLRCLVNNNKLTTGFDHPGIDLIGMLRPTMSTALWVQMLGRGTRPFPGKKNCLVLDFVGNTERLGPINDPVIPIKRKKGTSPGEPPIKICGVCGAYCHTSCRVCDLCFTPFPVVNKVNKEASSYELIRVRVEETTLLEQLKPPVITRYEVTNVTYQMHKKKGLKSSMPTMKVSYCCGLQQFHKWVAFDHFGYARKEAEKWWFAMCEGKWNPPPSVAEAVANSEKLLKIPTHITVSETDNSIDIPQIVNIEV